MIEAIYNVGKYVLNENQVSLDDTEKVTAILCEDPKSSDLYKTIITVELDKEGENITFIRVGNEEYAGDNIVPYLYRRGGSSGADLSPTCRLTEPTKTFNRKFLRWFETDFSNHSYILTEEEQNLLTNIKSCILSNSKQILEAITSQYLSLKKERQSGIITIVLHDNGEKKYLGDISAFRKILRVNALETYFKNLIKSQNQKIRFVLFVEKKRLKYTVLFQRIISILLISRVWCLVVSIKAKLGKTIPYVRTAH